MTEEIPAAGYKTKVKRKWIIPQGADTVNGFASAAYGELEAEGWTARAQIRSAAGGDTFVTFTSEAVTGPRITIEDYVGSMTAEDGTVVVNPSVVTIILPAATTEAVAWNDRTEGVYDLEIVSPTGGVIRLASGAVAISADVTRAL